MKTLLICIFAFFSYITADDDSDFIYYNYTELSKFDMVCVSTQMYPISCDSMVSGYQFTYYRDK